MNTKIVIFDLDGTLLDTIDDLADSCNKMLKEFSMPEHTTEEIKSFVGNGISVLVEKAVPGGRKNPLFQAGLRRMKEIYSENCMNKTKPYDEINSLLSKLSEKNIKSAILSNKPDSRVKELANHFFSEFIGQENALGDREGIEIKPSPKGIFELLKKLNCQKEECIYVGDSEVDIMTAKNAGVKCISALWGFREKEFLKENGADITAESPLEIIPIIENL